EEKREQPEEPIKPTGDLTKDVIQMIDKNISRALKIMEEYVKTRGQAPPPKREIRRMPAPQPTPPQEAKPAEAPKPAQTTVTAPSPTATTVTAPPQEVKVEESKPEAKPEQEKQEVKGEEKSEAGTRGSEEEAGKGVEGKK
ncbi:MAG: hypothetical protein MRT15_09640, partial [archaeon YNP-LCB-003-016]